jgi:hypothetical protein
LTGTKTKAAEIARSSEVEETNWLLPTTHESNYIEPKATQSARSGFLPYPLDGKVAWMLAGLLYDALSGLLGM